MRLFWVNEKFNTSKVGKFIIPLFSLLNSWVPLHSLKFWRRFLIGSGEPWNISLTISTMILHSDDFFTHLNRKNISRLNTFTL